MTAEERYSAITITSPYRSFDSNKTDLEVRSAQWTALIEEYSRRSLSNNGEKLVAIAELARHFSEIAGFPESDYIAGLWRHNFPSELLWTVSNGSPIHPLQCQAPSWSWASITGIVELNGVVSYRFTKTKIMIDIVEVGVIPLVDRFGQLRDACPNLKGHVARLRDIYNQYGHEYFSLQKRTYSMNFEIRTVESTFYVHLNNTEDTASFSSRVERFYSLPVFSKKSDGGGDLFYRTEGLILERIEQSRGCYRRVGTFKTETQYRDYARIPAECLACYEEQDLCVALKQISSNTILAGDEYEGDRTVQGYEISIY